MAVDVRPAATHGPPCGHGGQVNKPMSVTPAAAAAHASMPAGRAGERRWPAAECGASSSTSSRRSACFTARPAGMCVYVCIQSMLSTWLSKDSPLLLWPELDVSEPEFLCDDVESGFLPPPPPLLGAGLSSWCAGLGTGCKAKQGNEDTGSHARNSRLVAGKQGTQAQPSAGMCSSSSALMPHTGAHSQASIRTLSS